MPAREGEAFSYIADHLDSRITLPSIQCELSLAEVYDKVKLGPSLEGPPYRHSRRSAGARDEASGPSGSKATTSG